MPRIHKIFVSIVSFVLPCLLSVPVSAFELSGNKWPTNEIEFYVDIDGTAASGTSWNAAFIAAMNDWNEATSFNFILREDYKDPCAKDGFNSVDFVIDYCGSAFGENTLAVAVTSYQLRFWVSQLFQKQISSSISQNNLIFLMEIWCSLVFEGLTLGGSRFMNWVT